MKGIATQRYSWSSEPGRPAEEKTLDTFLREAAQVGYQGVEAYEEGISSLLCTYELKLAGAYAGVDAHLPWA